MSNSSRSNLDFATKFRLGEFIRAHDSEFAEKMYTIQHVAELATNELGVEVTPHHVGNLRRALKDTLTWRGGKTLPYGRKIKDRTRVVASCLVKVMHRLEIDIPDELLSIAQGRSHKSPASELESALSKMQ